MSVETKELSFVERFGDSLRSQNSRFTVPMARGLEKFSLIWTPKNETSLKGYRFEFNVHLERMRKTVARLSLLENLQSFGVEIIVNAKESLKPEIEKICPGLLQTSPLKQKELIQQALDYQTDRLDRLMLKMIQWTFLQTGHNKLSHDQVFDLFKEVNGTLTSKIKWIKDPFIPFFKLMIQEHTKWRLGSCKEATPEALSTFFKDLEKDVNQIQKQLPEMFYNTFLGADHPKVQENLKNQNDKVEITPDDVKGRIIALQLKAVAEFLSPTPEEQKACFELLTKLYKDKSQDNLSEKELNLFDKMLTRWAQIASGKIQTIPLTFFIENPSFNTEANREINGDLEHYKTATRMIDEIEHHSQEIELKFIRRTLKELYDQEQKLKKLEQKLAQLFSEKVALEKKLTKYPKELESKTVDEKIELMTLPEEIKQAFLVPKFFLERSRVRTQKSFDRHITQLTDQSVGQAQLNNLNQEILTTQNSLDLELKNLKIGLEELTKVRKQFKEICKVNLQRHKAERIDLLNKVYHLDHDEVKELTSTGLPF